MKLIRTPFQYRYFNAALILIAANVFVFALQSAMPSLGIFLAMTPRLVMRGWVWQFFTYMFAHAGFSHIFFNMLALFMFGTHTERRMGSREFLVYYLLSGFLAGVFSFAVYMVSGAGNVRLLGASGAIFAVQLAYASFFPDSRIYLWGILPLRAPVMVLAFTAIELVSTVFGVANGVAHLTHIAGFGFGWLYFVIRFGANPLRMMLGQRQ